MTQNDQLCEAGTEEASTAVSLQSSSDVQAFAGGHVSDPEEGSQQSLEHLDALDSPSKEPVLSEVKRLCIQIRSLMSALSETRIEVNELKGKVLNSDTDVFLGRVTERVACLEELMERSVAVDLKATMDTRLEFMEDLIGDAAYKHSREHEATHKKLQELQASITHQVMPKEASSPDGRVEGSEAWEVAHSQLKATLEARLEYFRSYLEGLCQDYAVEQRATMEAQMGELVVNIQEEMGDHRTIHLDHKATTESLLAEASERHQRDMAEHLTAQLQLKATVEAHGLCMKMEMAEHKTAYLDHQESMEARLRHLEERSLQGQGGDPMSDTSEAMSQAIRDAHTRLDDVCAVYVGCAKTEDHIMLEQRINCLESSFSDSAELQQTELADHRRVHLEEVTSMVSRLVYFENVLGEFTERQSRESEHSKAEMTMLQSELDSQVDSFQNKLSFDNEANKAKLIDLESTIITNEANWRAHWDQYKEVLSQGPSLQEAMETVDQLYEKLQGNMEHFERCCTGEMQRIWQAVDKQPPPTVIEKVIPVKPAVVLPTVNRPAPLVRTLSMAAAQEGSTRRSLTPQVRLISSSSTTSLPSTPRTMRRAVSWSENRRGHLLPTGGDAFWQNALTAGVSKLEHATNAPRGRSISLERKIAGRLLEDPYAGRLLGSSLLGPPFLPGYPLAAPTSTPVLVDERFTLIEPTQFQTVTSVPTTTTLGTVTSLAQNLKG